MISMDKKYRTRAKVDGSEPGYPVRILCVDANTETKRPIVGLVKHEDKETVRTWGSGGIYLPDEDSLDLIEISTYENLKIDDKVWAWNISKGRKFKAHFAGISENGRPMVFSEGMTSWTAMECQKFEFDFCEPAND